MSFLRGLDDDYEEVKAAAQATSSLGAPGYSDFCGAVNSSQGETLHHILAAVNDDLDADGDDSFSSRDWHTDTIIRFDDDSIRSILSKLS